MSAERAFLVRSANRAAADAGLRPPPFPPLGAPLPGNRVGGTVRTNPAVLPHNELS
ncbi:hypothetical protein COCSUDRAFT_60871 [Coccomyxa subellipsoidea C-169]|uniref:Uncharacterized protein n=1 Tax=Coccomyxa subellipsoidea (strain C-169) TaxID=574566 RepID=I0Z5E1_COCSC|nr:hypothetical protein COCSUDRAFT_60871 [Coccomyxa subellipsoidea C-169]EIE25860.1 hypothetical protein COCSUDRAFT_60871 [Coccomyxa subellipsoidea C-169]|eukprot:XP_005650404.1 hypothetical protein COCSUDRAFT_60871 [Coccomyxa subellipsoidea C-169]